MSDTFGTRLKVLRKSAGLTQQQLAEKLNIHERTVSKWERDLSEPDFGIYGLLSETLGVTLEELFGLSASNERIEGKFDSLSLGKKISNERKRLNESQGKLANIVMVSSNTVSKWEQGVVCPDRNTFLKLAEHFGMQPSALYYSVNSQGRVAKAAITKPNSNKKLSISLSIAAVVILVAAIVTLLCLLPFPGDNHINSDLPTNINKPQCEHNYQSRTIAATCASQGYELYTCVKCGDSYKSNYTPKTEHDYNSQTVAATCTSQGYELYTCVKCGGSYKSDYNPKIEHDYIVQWVEATCFSVGYNLHKCSMCGDSFESDHSSVAGHKYNIEYVAATCSSMGYELYTCILCGEFMQTNFTPKLEHTYNVQTIAATCTSEGYTLRECTVCDYSLKYNYTPQTAHNYSVEIIQSDDDGCWYKLFTCIDCGVTYKEEVTSLNELKLNYLYLNTKAWTIDRVYKSFDKRKKEFY